MPASLAKATAAEEIETAAASNKKSGADARQGKRQAPPRRADGHRSARAR
jgi:hypothetical protein